MDFEKIKELLDKYWEGETSLEEEGILRTYFSGEDIDDSLSAYQSLFQFQALEKQRTAPSTIKLPTMQPQPRKKKNRWWLLSIAASVALVVSVSYWGMQNSSTEGEKTVLADTYENPEEAYQEARTALLLIANKLNKGKDITKKSLRAAK